MRVVLDCNVLISAGLTDGACRQVLAEVIRRHDWFYSPPLLAELLAVTAYPRLAKYRHKLEQIATVMVAIGHEVAPAPDLITLPDPDDVVYLQTALAAAADVLVTGNLRDFQNAAGGNIRILSPREFLTMIGECGLSQSEP